MSEIRVTVTDQVLTLEDKPLIASGGVEENKIKFDFDSTWDGYIKVAVFYQDKEHVYRQIVQADNSCIVPKEATLNPGTMFFGVFGAKGDKILTSEVIRYRIVQGAITEDTTPADPTPDIYAQMLQIYNTLKTDFSSMLAKLGEKSVVSDERNISTFWQSLEYVSKYMDTTLRDLLNQAIANSSTQGIIDLINESVIPKFAEVKNKIETEAVAVKNEILDNKVLMYLQAAQISPNTYMMNSKRLLEFVSIKECRDLYTNSYTDFKNKLLYHAARFKVAGSLMNIVCNTSIFSDVDGKTSDSSNSNYFEPYLFNTVQKVKTMLNFSKEVFFESNRTITDWHYIIPLLTKRYTSTKTTNSNDTITFSFLGKGLLFGAFQQGENYKNSDSWTVGGITTESRGDYDTPIKISNMTVDGKTITPMYFGGGGYSKQVVRYPPVQFNSSVTVTFVGLGYDSSKNVYGGIIYIPY